MTESHPYTHLTVDSSSVERMPGLKRKIDEEDDEGAESKVILSSDWSKQINTDV